MRYHTSKDVQCQKIYVYLLYLGQLIAGGGRNLTGLRECQIWGEEQCEVDSRSGYETQKWKDILRVSLHYL